MNYKNYTRQKCDTNGYDTFIVFLGILLILFLFCFPLKMQYVKNWPPFIWILKSLIGGSMSPANPWLCCQQQLLLS